MSSLFYYFNIRQLVNIYIIKNILFNCLINFTKFKTRTNNKYDLKTNIDFNIFLLYLAVANFYYNLFKKLLQKLFFSFLYNFSSLSYYNLYRQLFLSKFNCLALYAI